MQSELTARQQIVLDFIKAELAAGRRPPTIRQIAAYLGVASTNGVVGHLRRIAKKGYIRIDRRLSCGIVVVVDRGIPLLTLDQIGGVSCEAL